MSEESEMLPAPADELAEAGGHLAEISKIMHATDAALFVAAYPVGTGLALRSRPRRARSVLR